MIVCRLKQMLEKQGMSRNMLSQKTGIRANTICSLASGNCANVRREVIDKLCQEFSCSVGDLFLYIPDEKAADGIDAPPLLGKESRGAKE